MPSTSASGLGEQAVPRLGDRDGDGDLGNRMDLKTAP